MLHTAGFGIMSCHFHLSRISFYSFFDFFFDSLVVQEHGVESPHTCTFFTYLLVVLVSRTIVTGKFA